MGLIFKLKLIAVSFGILWGCAAEESQFQTAKQQARVKTDKDRAEDMQQAADARAVVTLEFQAGEIKEAALEYDPDHGTVHQAITHYQKPKDEKVITQIERRLTPLQFTQGYDGGLVEEQFNATEPGKLDMLIVVDNSPNMGAIQDQVKGALPALLTYLQDVNWQIAVNTTSSPCLRQTGAGLKVITKAQYDADTAQAISDYGELISPPANSNIERGIKSAALGLLGECNGETENWRRPGAKPAVLILSDEKNCGSAVNEGCTGDDAETLTADFFLDRVPDARVYGLLMLDYVDANCPNDDFGYYDNYYPEHYVDLINRTNGIYDRICQVSYGTVMERISQDVSLTILKSFVLKYDPESEPIVSVDGAVTDKRYTVSGKVINMQEDFAVTAETLTISYYVGAIERRQVYDLEGVPDPATLQVLINGVDQDIATYKILENPYRLSFAEMPPDQATIGITYRQNTPLETSFVLNRDTVKETVEVFVDGIEVGQPEFDWDAGRVSIVPPPMDGQKIRLLYESRDHRQLGYPVGEVDPLLVEGVQAVDSRTGESMKVEFRDGVIFFDWGDVKPGRVVDLYYDIIYSGDDLNFQIPLAMTPLEGSISVETPGNLGNCRLVDEQLQGLINVGCAEDDFGKLKISYSYGVDYRSTFGLTDEAEYSRFMVYIDGEKIDRFELVDLSKLAIDPEILNIGSKVKVVIVP